MGIPWREPSRPACFFVVDVYEYHTGTVPGTYVRVNIVQVAANNNDCNEEQHDTDTVRKTP